MKITGLPLNTTAFDLKDYVESYNIKYCHVPRNPKTNRPKPMAIMYFSDDENFEIATTKGFFFNNKQIYWTTLEQKTCHRCGSPEHEIKNCSERKYTPRRFLRRGPQSPQRLHLKAVHA